MGVAKAAGKAAIELGQQVMKKFAKKGYTKDLAPQVVKSLTDHINITKAADVGEMETMFKGMKAGDEVAYESFNDFSKTLSAADQYQSNVDEMTRTVRGYTRPDAVENLRQLGGQTKFGKTARTIQGPVPPRLDDKTFAQGAKTQEEAIMAGTTKFVKEGDPFQIRNYAAGYAPKGQTTKVGTRKTTGRGITAEGNTRKINEMLATDPNITPEETAEFGRLMAQAAAEGMDGDHIIEVSRVANAVRNMSPERKAAYFEIMRRTGTPTGNHPKNIQKLTKEMNQVVKPAQIRALDNALRGMDKRGKSLLEDLLGI